MANLSKARQRAMLERMRSGESNPEIARAQRLGESTVRKYRKRWLAEGLLEPDGPLLPAEDVTPTPAEASTEPAALEGTGSEYDERADAAALEEAATELDQAQQTGDAIDRLRSEQVIGAVEDPPATPPPLVPAGAGAPPAENAPGTAGDDVAVDVDPSPWQYRVPPVPPPPAAATVGPAQPPAAAGNVDPTAIELMLQIPLEHLALWHLMRADGYPGNFNDWYAETVDLHFGQCRGLNLAIVRQQATEAVA